MQTRIFALLLSAIPIFAGTANAALFTTDNLGIFLAGTSSIETLASFTPGNEVAEITLNTGSLTAKVNTADNIQAVDAELITPINPGANFNIFDFGGATAATALGFYSGSTDNLGTSVTFDGAANPIAVPQGGFFGILATLGMSLPTITVTATTSGTAQLLNPPDLFFYLGEARSITPPPSSVPEPSTLAVMAIGMIGVVGGGIRRRRRASK